MAWTFVDSDGVGEAASSTTVVTPGLTVNAGDLVVVLVTREGSEANTLSVSDGTSTLTEWSVGQKDAGQFTLDVFYILASVASGTNSVVYTATFGAARGYRNIAAMVFTPPAAASLDGTPVAAFGTSTSLASGNITTTGTDGVAFGFYAEYGQDLGSEQINGVALARKQEATGLRGELWQIAYSAGFTGQATATLGVSAPWIGGVIAFNAAAGGAVDSNFIFSRW